MDDLELFDKYINDELTPDKKAEFEARLKEDKNFAIDFEVYCVTVVGICKEAEQDNKDFELAMKHLSEEELTTILGVKRPTAAAPKVSSFKKWVFWQGFGIAALLGLGIIYIVIARHESSTTNQEAYSEAQQTSQLSEQEDEGLFVLDSPVEMQEEPKSFEMEMAEVVETKEAEVAPKIETQSHNNIAMADKEQFKVENAIYDIMMCYDTGVRSRGVNPLTLSDKELRNQLSQIEKDFQALKDLDDIADYGNDLVLIYLRLHETQKAKDLLQKLIAKFQNNEDYGGFYKRWKTMLNLLN